MTDKYYKLCAALLEMASNEFSNHGCNDMPDEFFIGWTKEERQQLAKDFEDYNSGGKYYEPNHIHIPDSSLMSFFAHKLSEHSALKEQEVVGYLSEHQGKVTGIFRKKQSAEYRKAIGETITELVKK